MARPRWLIVVDRDRSDIFEDFRRRFQGWARVILDRRGPELDRLSFEGPDRRRASTERRNPFRQGNTYRLAYKVEGFELHELTDDAADESFAEAGRPGRSQVYPL